MPTQIACPTPSASSAFAALDLAALHLQRVASRLADSVVVVRALAASTDWQTPAARAFFALAEHLEGDIVSLGPVAEAVRGEITRARARIVLERMWDCR